MRKSRGLLSLQTTEPAFPAGGHKVTTGSFSLAFVLPLASCVRPLPHLFGLSVNARRIPPDSSAPITWPCRRWLPRAIRLSWWMPMNEPTTNRTNAYACWWYYFYSHEENRELRVWAKRKAIWSEQNPVVCTEFQWEKHRHQMHLTRPVAEFRARPSDTVGARFNTITYKEWMRQLLALMEDHLRRRCSCRRWWWFIPWTWGWMIQVQPRMNCWPAGTWSDHLPRVQGLIDPCMHCISCVLRACRSRGADEASTS